MSFIRRSLRRKWFKVAIKVNFIALCVYTYINVFMGSIINFYQYKNSKTSQIFHTGPLK